MSNISCILRLILVTVWQAMCPAASLNCHPPSINYNNQSCYIFIGQQFTAEWWKDIAKYPPKTPNGKSRGFRGQDLAPCVWDRAQAVQICDDAERLSGFQAFENYDTKWHLPVLETYEEDEWLAEEIYKRHSEIGTHVWIDLVKEFDDYVWRSTGEEANIYVDPPGIDWWWERTNVQMRRTREDEVMCHETHTDYNVSRNTSTMRRPHTYIQLRGWHPRACHHAYEHESYLDHEFDFTMAELEQAEFYWIGSNIRRDLKENREKEHGYIIPDKCFNGTRGDKTCPGKRWNCEDPAERYKGAYRMRNAPIGVVCEADIKEF